MNVRAAVRYAIALLGAFLTVNRLQSAWNEWVLWHMPEMQNDPSALELYQSGFWVDIASAVAACAVAGTWFWYLGRRPNPQITMRREE
jgi:hypothetical protein